MSESLFSITTEVEEAKVFDIDGQVYKLLGMEHLSPDEEAKATAAFTRFQQLVSRLERAGSDKAAEQIASQLRERRLQLITMLTTVPHDVAETLPLSAQTQLFKEIQKESGDDEAVEE